MERPVPPLLSSALAALPTWLALFVVFIWLQWIPIAKRIISERGTLMAAMFLRKRHIRAPESIRGTVVDQLDVFDTHVYTVANSHIACPEPAITPEIENYHAI